MTQEVHIPRIALESETPAVSGRPLPALTRARKALKKVRTRRRVACVTRRVYRRASACLADMAAKRYSENSSDDLISSQHKGLSISV